MLISNLTEKNRQSRVLFFLLFSLNDLYASGYTNDFLQEIQRNICHTSTGTYLMLLVQEITRGDVANENGKNWLFWPKILDPKILGSKVKLSQVEIQVSAKFRGRVLKCRRNSAVITVGTYNVPEGPCANPYSEARSAEGDGVGSGWTEYQKCPLIFFILCRYIDKVYTYIYMR